MTRTVVVGIGAALAMAAHKTVAPLAVILRYFEKEWPWAEGPPDDVRHALLALKKQQAVIAAAPDGDWLVRRALTILECSAGPYGDEIATFKKWTKAEQKRSWDHWKDVAGEYIAKTEGRAT